MRIDLSYLPLLRARPSPYLTSYSYAEISHYLWLARRRRLQGRHGEAAWLLARAGAVRRDCCRNAPWNQRRRAGTRRDPLASTDNEGTQRILK